MNCEEKDGVNSQFLRILEDMSMRMSIFVNKL